MASNRNDASASTSTQLGEGAATAKRGGSEDGNKNPVGVGTSLPSQLEAENSIITSKIDPITALQDAIDGLSLSMFEALRKLRDAVAPESGNLGGANNANNTNGANNVNNSNAGNNNNNNNANSSSNTSQEQPDVDELWHLYKSGDRVVTAMVQKACSGGNNSPSSSSSSSLPTRRDEFVRLHAQMELTKDKELVSSLVLTVLQKSADINTSVENNVPGMHRTAAQQMEYIEQLLKQHESVGKELEETYQLALQRRQECRKFVIEKTTAALGIEGPEGQEQNVGEPDVVR